MTARILIGLGVVMFAAPGWAQNDQTTTPPAQLPPHPAVIGITPLVPPPTLVNSHTLFLNSCRPSGCVIKRGGTDDSRTNTSQIAPQNGTLTALKSTVNFAAIKTCVEAALAPFNIQVTDVDPGNVPHFEMIIAGSPQEIGFDTGFQGVAPYLCSGAPGNCFGTYIPNAITFAFGNTAPDVTLLCGVALQETAHGWTLDHATATSDPMTYKTYTVPLLYRDNAPCGSDCIYQCPGNAGAACNAFGVQCAGTNTNGTHVCMENGQATQNELQILNSLFGPAGSVAPTVKITSPSTGAGEQIGNAFAVNATCETGDGIKEIDFLVDDVQRGTTPTSPASFSAPTTLAAGTHHIQVICGTNKQATASAAIDVLLGNTCAVDADCGGNGKICYQMACIDGSTAVGGLGAPCTGNGDCKSGQCGADGDQMLCVIPCDPNMAACPDGFGCLSDGNGGGVCWLGADSGGGCCETGKHRDNRGALVLGLGLVALFFWRRKPAARARS